LSGSVLHNKNSLDLDALVCDMPRKALRHATEKAFSILGDRNSGKRRSFEWFIGTRKGRFTSTNDHSASNVAPECVD